MNQKAYNAIIRARTALLVDNPFYGCLALHLDVIECGEDDVIISKLFGLPQTMAVDGFNMYYFPEFVLKLSEQELMGVVAHEVSHCAYQHMTRRGTRDPRVWNWAGDYVINADLRKCKFVLPEPHLYDAKYEGMSTDEVYEKLIQELEKQPQQEQGDGEGGYGEGDERNDVGTGSVIDAADATDKPAQDKAARDWDAATRMAVNAAKGANAGQVPAHLQRLVKQLQDPQVDWRELVRPWIDNSMSKDYSWSRPNRRYIAHDLCLPGFVPDALHHMLMAIDVSGSVTDKMIEAMISEAKSVLDDGVADKVTVIYADTKVHKVSEFVTGDLVEPEDCPDWGGGTDFDDTLEWVIANAPDASCLVYLTDMLTSSFGKDPGLPTLWAAYLPEQHLAQIKVPFGEIIAVKTPGY